MAKPIYKWYSFTWYDPQVEMAAVGERVQAIWIFSKTHSYLSMGRNSIVEVTIVEPDCSAIAHTK
jgi:hypothetical protein